jgi:hypothetical protein
MEDIISVYRHCYMYFVMLSDWLAFFQLDLLEPDTRGSQKHVNRSPGSTLLSLKHELSTVKFGYCSHLGW